MGVPPYLGDVERIARDVTVVHHLHVAERVHLRSHVVPYFVCSGEAQERRGGEISICCGLAVFTSPRRPQKTKCIHNSSLHECGQMRVLRCIRKHPFDFSMHRLTHEPAYSTVHPIKAKYPRKLERHAGHEAPFLASKSLKQSECESKRTVSSVPT